jgi:hypothetical protein
MALEQMNIKGTVWHVLIHKLPPITFTTKPKKFNQINTLDDAYRAHFRHELLVSLVDTI